jgi:YVTN family beta-propeller protein
MNLRVSGLLAAAAFALAGVLSSAQSLAQNAYITNLVSNNVSVIDTKTNTVTATIPVGNSPWGVAVSPDGRSVYVTNIRSGTVSVIDTRTNTVVATIPAGSNPYGVAVSPDGRRLYVSNDNLAASTVTVIDAATGATIATIPTGNGNATASVTVSPDGKKVYAVNLSTGEDAVSVIDAATNAVMATVSTPGKWNAYQAAFSPPDRHRPVQIRRVQAERTHQAGQEPGLLVTWGRAAVMCSIFGWGHEPATHPRLVEKLHQRGARLLVMDRAGAVGRVAR